VSRPEQALNARSVALSASSERKRTATSGLGSRVPRPWAVRSIGQEAVRRDVLASRRKGEVGGRSLDYATVRHSEGSADQGSPRKSRRRAVRTQKCGGHVVES